MTSYFKRCKKNVLSYSKAETTQILTEQNRIHSKYSKQNIQTIAEIGNWVAENPYENKNAEFLNKKAEQCEEFSRFQNQYQNPKFRDKFGLIWKAEKQKNMQ